MCEKDILKELEEFFSGKRKVFYLDSEIEYDEDDYEENIISKEEQDRRLERFTNISKRINN